jgi:predicted dinucleotide-binding enzyme
VRSKGAGSLVGVLGFEPVDAGPLKNARLLEPFAMVWIDQAMSRGPRPRLRLRAGEDEK